VVFGIVVMVKVTLVLPAGTVTLAGTVAQHVSWLDRPTVTPRVGSGLERITVPVDGLAL